MARGEDYGSIIPSFPFPCWRLRVCGVGMAMERSQPHQYVPCRGCLLSSFGQDRTGKAFPRLQMSFGGSSHHGRGAADRSARQPGLPGVGLPKNALSLYGADLSELQFALDSRELWGDAHIPGFGKTIKESSIAALLLGNGLPRRALPSSQ